jgi:hypothetical protein
MLHRHQHCCQYKIDVNLANMLHKHQHCFHYKIDVSLANMLHRHQHCLSLHLFDIDNNVDVCVTS